MTLQEVLKGFNLDDEQIKSVNTAVDALLASKSDESNAQLAERDGNIKSLTDELAPHRAAAQDEKMKTLMPENVNPEAAQDLVAVAGISEDDDDETIKTKLSEALESRPHLQKTDTADEAAAGKTNTKVEESDGESEDDDSEYDNF